ncbi:Tellurite resistance protein TehA [Thiorhodovibrio winogradskyi]|uniref:Tellurite resistance protein TehA n=2 Tax=Thiorhodovibrio winogradskyi TaxID=77007 RepID=A0ABZ0S594_9GAMM
MGLTGLTIAWEKAQHVFSRDIGITIWLVVLSSIAFTVIGLFYTAKLILYRKAVVSELRHPVKLNFFPTISISLLLLAIAYLAINPAISRPLWMAGTLLHLFFTLYVVSVWMHHEHFEVHHMNPAWFIPAVGNVLVPVAGVPLGFVDVSWFFFSTGMVFWGMLMTIVFYRILFHNPIDDRLMPTLFILIAPPAVGFIAYTRLTGDIDTIARLLYFSGLFLTLLLFTQVGRFAKLEFFLSWWAYSFPLAAICIASLVFYEMTDKLAFGYIGAGLLLIVSSVVCLLMIKTIVAISKHRICLPGH